MARVPHLHQRRKITVGQSEGNPRSWPDNLEAQSAIVAAWWRHKNLLQERGLSRSQSLVPDFGADDRSSIAFSIGALLPRALAARRRLRSQSPHHEHALALRRERT
jgi:hypothetical protein